MSLTLSFLIAVRKRGLNFGFLNFRGRSSYEKEGTVTFLLLRNWCIVLALRNHQITVSWWNEDWILKLWTSDRPDAISKGLEFFCQSCDEHFIVGSFIFF